MANKKYEKEVLIDNVKGWTSLKVVKLTKIKSLSSKK